MLESDPTTSEGTPEDLPVKSLEQRFHELAVLWKQERGPYSSSAKLCNHPAYQQIIEMGMVAVPLLLGELAREPDHWFRALHAISGTNPVLEGHQGNIR